MPTDVVARGPIEPSTLVMVPAYDHTCCWEVIWPSVLADVDQPKASDC